MTGDQDRRITEVVTRERSRLRRFIERRVSDPRDAEDILQDVFHELAETNRRLMPIEHVTAWLFRVARNRITDLFRKKRPERLPAPPDDVGAPLGIDALLPSPEDGPEAMYARGVLLQALADAVEALPPAQRAVFVAHELEGRSFKALSAESGVPVNTLLWRKHAAVRQLRRQLHELHEAMRNLRSET